MRLQGLAAVVTGGGRGIGRAVAARLLQEGARVLICDVHPDRVASATRELTPLGTISGVTADISHEAEVDRLFETADDRLGRVDLLVNNAGIARSESVLEMSPANWDRTLAVNLRGAFLCAQAAARRMVKTRSGVMVHISSTNGLFGEARLANYNAAKAGLILLSKTLALELGPFGVRSVAVCPGYILTDLSREVGGTDESIKAYLQKIPIGRYGTPDDVASLVAFLASSEAGFITGAEFVIDGGQTAKQ